MTIGIVSAAYISAAVLFILSLGGLSGQESAKRAVWYGIVGMALAVVATIFGPGVGNWFIILLMIAGGSVLGTYVASRVQMTEMPQLVAALHSFVGLAAVFIGFNAHIEAANIAGMDEAARSALSGFAGILAHKSPVELASVAITACEPAHCFQRVEIVLPQPLLHEFQRLLEERQSVIELARGLISNRQVEHRHQRSPTVLAKLRAE